MMTKPTEEFAQGQARILSNTTYLLAASVIQKLISVGYFVYYYNRLGKTGAGDFEPVRAAIPIVLLLIDISLSVILTREIGRSPERAKSLLSVFLGVKLFLTALALAAFFIVFSLVPFDEPTRILMPLAGLIVMLDAFTLTFASTFRGLQIFRYEAIGIVATQLSTVIVGGACFALGLGLRSPMFGLLAGSITNFVYVGLMLRRKLGGLPRPSWDSKIIKLFVVAALPILGAALLAKLFTYTDRYLLLTFAGKGAFAVYSAAHKVPFSMEFVASAFAASLLPAMSAYFINSREQLRRVFQQALRYLLIISVPLAIGVFVLAEPIITKLLGPSFHEAVHPLRIMIIALPFIFLNFPVGNFLIASNKQIWNTVNLGTAVIVNVSLNIFLQPKFGIVGAAYAVLATYVILFTLGLIQVNRVIELQVRALMRTVAQTLCAAAVMAVPIWLLAKTFSPYFLVLPGGLLYIAALFLLRGLTRADLALALRAIGRKAD